eukprot:971600-Amphidinium_carterae.1
MLSQGSEVKRAPVPRAMTRRGTDSRQGNTAKSPRSWLGALEVLDLCGRGMEGTRVNFDLQPAQLA